MLDGTSAVHMNGMVHDAAARDVVISLSNTLERVARALEAVEVLTEDALGEVVESFAALAGLGGICHAETCRVMHSVATWSAFVKVGQLLMDAGEVAPAGLRAAETVVVRDALLVSSV